MAHVFRPGGFDDDEENFSDEDFSSFASGGLSEIDSSTSDQRKPVASAVKTPTSETLKNGGLTSDVPVDCI